MRNYRQDYDEPFEKEMEEHPRAGERKMPSKAVVLHADADLIVVDKPPGLSVIPLGDDEPSVSAQLCEAGAVRATDEISGPYPMDPRLSGIVVLLRSRQAAQALLSQIETGTFVLTCTAVVRGRPMENAGKIDIPLRRTKSGRHLRVDRETGHPATTSFVVRDSFIGFALLECTPASADPDQVRVHLQTSGMTLAVDPDYGGSQHLMLSSFKSGYRPSQRRPERPLIERPSLHVSHVAFNHPISGEPCSFESPLPRDMKAALHQLDRFGRLPHHP